MADPLLTEPEKKENDSSVFDVGDRPNYKPLGTSGTDIYSGYFSEEYLQQLRGRQGAKVFDEMRRSESQVAMLMNAVMNPIKAATWDVEAPADVAGSEEHKAFIEFNLKECIDWEAHLHEALTMLFHGYSVFEEIDAVVFNHPKFGTKNVLKAMAFRSQKTIERWIVEPTTGKLLKVVQWVMGDLAPSATMLEMDARFVRVFTLSKEGDNYEGISALRPMYGAYYRKNLYLKIAAIGLETSAKGIPMGTIPAKMKSSDQEVEGFKAMLSSFTAHESSYIVKPEGWNVEIIKNEFDADKVKEMITLENTEMINSLVANFLALGTSGSGGSFALGSDLSDFFLTGIQNYANILCGVWNRVIIPRLIKLNYGEQANYPKLVANDINDKAGKELSEIVKSLVDGKIIKPDDKLEESMRKRYALPKADPTTARNVEPPKPAFGGQFSETRIQLAESYKKQWNTNKDMVKDEMQTGLRVLLDNYKKQIRYKWPQTTKAQRPLIALQLEPKGLPAYKADLKETLAEVATQALNDAKKLTPKAKSVKLSEIQLAAPRGGYFEALPPNIKRIVKTQAELIGESQAADLLKIVSFQFNSSQSSTDDVDQVLLDIEDAAAPSIDGATGKGMSVDAAAGNAVSTVANQAQLEWFFEPEVLDTIESFTFYNEDPQSEICQELDGTTWAVNDPDIDKYSPPLHHNCKSRLIPNEKGAKNNPEIERTGAVSQKALDSMTLCECNYHLEFKLKEYQWAELSPEDQKKVSDKIAKLVAEGKDQSQAAAIAYSMLERGEL